MSKLRFSGNILEKIFDKEVLMTTANWPQKTILHDHLDGSRALVPVLPKLFELSGKKYPFDPLGDVHGDMAKLFKDPQIDIVQKFSNTTGVMQSRETLSLAAESYVWVRAQQGFEYCEATIAPQYFVFGGLTEKEVVEALIEGIKIGEENFPNIEVNLLFAVGREVSSEEAVRLVNIASKCDRNYVVGIGLVCDEAKDPPEKHKAMFKRAKELGFKTTCHAGEWCHYSFQKPDYERDRDWLLRNIRIAVYDLEVDRLGHAIPLAYDIFLMDAIRERNIAIEGCPGSNLSSGLIPNTGYLKIRELLAFDINYSLNPDDDLFMPELDEVFSICDGEYCFTEEEKQKLLRNPWIARFSSRKEHKF